MMSIYNMHHIHDWFFYTCTGGGGRGEGGREGKHLIRAVTLSIMLNSVLLGVLVIAGERREECRHAFGQV